MSEAKPSNAGEVIFWCLFVADTVIALVVLWFLLEGLGDGKVSSFNAEIWILLVVGVLGIPALSLLLRSTGRRAAGAVLSAVLVIPGCLIGLLFLLLMSSRDFR
jgi:hypothetical protein